MNNKNDTSIRKDISIKEINDEYIIEVYSWDYTKEKVEKELANIDNKLLKQHLLKFYRASYTYQFYLSDNPYLDYLK